MHRVKALTSGLLLSWLGQAPNMRLEETACQRCARTEQDLQIFMLGTRVVGALCLPCIEIILSELDPVLSSMTDASFLERSRLEEEVNRILRSGITSN